MGLAPEKEVFGHHIWKTDFNSKYTVTACLSWQFEATPGLNREEWPKWFARAIGKMVWVARLPKCLSFLWPIKSYTQSNLHILTLPNFIFCVNRFKCLPWIFISILIHQSPSVPRSNAPSFCHALLLYFSLLSEQTLGLPSHPGSAHLVSWSTCPLLLWAAHCALSASMCHWANHLFCSQLLK